VSPAPVRARRGPPVERIRDALRDAAGDGAARALPTGYQRLGHVLVVRWPDALRPQFPFLVEAFRHAFGVRTILRHRGPIDGELRHPRLEVLLDGPTETDVLEGGVRWRFDAAQIMFSSGNRTERQRAGLLVRPGESVVDLFAGIGYFALPAAKVGRAGRVFAVDRNPLSVHYLAVNARRNGVEDRMEIRLGDNRGVEIPGGGADRIFLGYLPSALPWVGPALPLLRPEGGWLHVHLVVDARRAKRAAADAVQRAVAEGGGALRGAAQAREVKPYGPGRTHVVVDAPVAPPRR
jgi:tRNA wybutosine-synthesizing protein 2